MMILAVGIVLISLFQAIDNYYAHRRQDREGVTIRDQNATINNLSSRLRADEDFFAVVRQLIILGPNADAGQRQAIIDELKKQADARLPQQPSATTTPANTTTTTIKKASGESTTTLTTRPNSQPQPSRSTTTTTTGLLPPPSSLVPLPSPPSSLPPVSVCTGNTCVAIPPVTFPVFARSYEKEELRRYEKPS